MQAQQTDRKATASVPAPAVAGDGRAFGPEQAARYLGLRRRERDYLVEAGFLAPSGRSATGTLRFAEAVLDSVADEPLSWSARSAKSQRPSPWRELAGSASERARLVDVGFTDPQSVRIAADLC
ncbi:hypothetical protein [Streptomyces rhizosphaericus]|uniref:hypothetical protein n=1 Tax=Streptomyces rhizosphaericus TaxID=114699 RepID=UPI000A3C6F3B|nr:hypothetical protein [Streptomyces rhizosphaericus]